MDKARQIEPGGTESAARLALLDPVMGRVIARIGPIRFKPRRLPTFQALVHAVVFQQLSGSVANTIMQRFRALFPAKEFPTPQEVLAVGEAKLRAAGLSSLKCRYIFGIAEQAVAGRIPSLAECDLLTDAEIISRLTQLDGVGRWTAEMFLIFDLGRPDVLPVHDLGVRQGYKIAFSKRTLPTAAQLERAGERWAPYRTTAALYLWRVANPKGGIGW